MCIIHFPQHVFSDGALNCGGFQSIRCKLCGNEIEVEHVRVRGCRKSILSETDFLSAAVTCCMLVRPFSWVNSEILIVAVLTRCRDKEGRVDFISVKQHYNTNTA